MTVLDSSTVIDFLISDGVAVQVEDLVLSGERFQAPDVIIFEILAVLRRAVLGGSLSDKRARGAVEDLADLPIDIYSSLIVCDRAWELKDNFTAADALFVSLAEHFQTPLITKDKRLAKSAKKLVGIKTLVLEDKET